METKVWLMLSAILSFCVGLGTVLYHVFVTAKFFAKIDLAVETFGNKISEVEKKIGEVITNMVEVFGLKITNICEDVSDLKDDQKETNKSINEILLKQVNDIGKTATIAHECAKSAHHRLDGMNK